MLLSPSNHCSHIIIFTKTDYAKTQTMQFYFHLLIGLDAFICLFLTFFFLHSHIVLRDKMLLMQFQKARDCPAVSLNIFEIKNNEIKQCFICRDTDVDDLFL